MIPKFRAWQIPTKKMREVTALEFSEGSLEYICFDYEELGYLPSDIVLMQSTGVVDCNNRLIYEGDVIESTWWNINDERYRKRGVVDFRHGCFGIRYTEDKEGDIIQALCCAIVPKVIGNIYENPDLVED